jgi:hypothetical protein
MARTFSMSTANVNIDADAARKEWVDRLAVLVDEIERWSGEIGWSTRRIETQLQESQIGSYSAPALLMQEGTTKVLLEPVARFATGADGVVDLYLVPAYDDIASLYFYDGKWHLHYMFQGTPTVPDIR